MPQIKCEGPNCWVCRTVGESDRVNVLIEDEKEPIGSPNRRKWMSMSRKTYDQI